MGLVVGVRKGLVVASLLCSLLYAVILLTPVLARLPGLSWTVDLFSFYELNSFFKSKLFCVSQNILP